MAWAEVPWQETAADLKSSSLGLAVMLMLRANISTATLDIIGMVNVIGGGSKGQVEEDGLLSSGEPISSSDWLVESLRPLTACL
ncbi:hypothetical protein EYF80_007430 [Liparis tanakae]|uniref:Uncharacterized protein n=1 Tax=Liparis tanakae TaxID=230148 RepID=A0A4Z2IWF1_9TELE|nr:hypothetical protein EYF80_007430 [Liparis tanakae]